MKQNRLMKWIVGLLTMLPFLAIAVTCAYVTFNKNAKDSYYGETINEVTYTSANSEIELNKEYYLTLSYYTSLIDTAKNIQTSQITNFTSNDSGVITQYETNKNNINNIYILNNGTNNMYVSFRQDTSTLFNVAVQNKILSFNFYASSEITLTNQYNDFIKVINYNKYSYLDNAFYYAIEQFNDMGFDKIDFVSWFDVFNSTPSIYTTFINCYANYMLFVACITFLPRILYWFINFAFRVIDRFANYGGRW